jgi:hypothetical protein
MDEIQQRDGQYSSAPALFLCYSFQAQIAPLTSIHRDEDGKPRTLPRRIHWIVEPLESTDGKPEDPNIQNLVLTRQLGIFLFYFIFHLSPSPTSTIALTKATKLMALSICFKASLLDSSV